MGDFKIKRGLSAQVSLEFTSAFIVLILLLLATGKLFVWCTENIVKRHKAYENTRTVVLDGDELAQPNIDFYEPTKLEIFKK